MKHAVLQVCYTIESQAI